MTRDIKKQSGAKMNGTMDITKLLMAILVIGIHTEPLGFNFWLDKGFGIITRLCVPFFFVTSAFFFWKKEKSIKAYLQRIIIIYVIWSIIYLPFDVAELGQMTVHEILTRFLWNGNEHALWYLCGTIIGFIITSVLLKIIKPKQVLVIAILFLVIGTLKSTYSTAMNQLFGINLPNYLGSRNGLFYGFPYIALGMVIAKTKTQGIVKNKRMFIIGFLISIMLLAIESYLFVFIFKANSAVLWLSVFPLTYFLFEIVLNTDIQLDWTISLTLRRASTLMYVSQYLFIPALSLLFNNMLLFVFTVFITGIFSLIIIKLSETKHLGFLRYLY